VYLEREEKSKNLQDVEIERRNHNGYEGEFTIRNKIEGPEKSDRGVQLCEKVSKGEKHPRTRHHSRNRLARNKERPLNDLLEKA